MKNDILKRPRDMIDDSDEKYDSWLKQQDEEKLKEEFFSTCEDEWHCEDDMIEMEEDGTFDGWLEERYQKELESSGCLK